MTQQQPAPRTTGSESTPPEPKPAAPPREGRLKIEILEDPTAPIVLWGDSAVHF